MIVTMWFYWSGPEPIPSTVDPGSQARAVCGCAADGKCYIEGKEIAGKLIALFFDLTIYDI